MPSSGYLSASSPNQSSQVKFRSKCPPVHRPPQPLDRRPSQLGALILRGASLPLPGKVVATQDCRLPGFPARSVQTPSQRTRRPVTKLGIAQIRARAAGLPAPTERPASELPLPGNPGAGGNLGGALLPGLEAPAKFPPEQQPEVSDAWEGRGRGGRGPGGQTRRGCALGRCFWATGAGQLAASSQSSSGKAPPSQPSAARSQHPPSSAQRRGPGTRTPERKEDAPAAAPHLPRWLTRAASSPPGRSRCVHGAARTHSTWPNSKEPGAEEGAPRGSGAGLGGGGGRGGEGREQQVLQLPSVPTARQRRARDAGGEGSARSANEFTFFFSPALSPSPFPPAPPASSLAAGCRGPARVFGSRPGSWRMETAREEVEGKVRRRAGRPAREQHPGPSVCGGGRAGRVCPSRARTRVRVCACGSEASTGAYHALPPPRGSRESPIPGRAGPAAIIYNPGLLHSATCQDDGVGISGQLSHPRRWQCETLPGRWIPRRKVSSPRRLEGSSDLRTGEGTPHTQTSLTSPSSATPSIECLPSGLSCSPHAPASGRILEPTTGSNPTSLPFPPPPPPPSLPRPLSLSPSVPH